MGVFMTDAIFIRNYLGKSRFTKILVLKARNVNASDIGGDIDKWY